MQDVTEHDDDAHGEAVVNLVRLSENLSSSCMAIAARAAAVALGNVSQNPSPSGFTMRPSWAAAWPPTNSLCSINSACRSASASARNRSVEPLMSVFMMTVARRLVTISGRPVS
jgi:hypothetical protein